MRCHGVASGLPSGIVGSVRFSILATSSSLTPNTTSESRYLSPSMKTCVINGWWPGASTRKCTWAGRIACPRRRPFRRIGRLLGVIIALIIGVPDIHRHAHQRLACEVGDAALHEHPL